MAIYVISDLHGQYSLFKKMLKLINFSNKDTLYIIGDVIDRGPESIPMLLDIANRDNVQLIMGNHEKMMLNAINIGGYDNYRLWFRNGGNSTNKQFEDLYEVEKSALLNYLENLPYHIEIELHEKKYYLAHSTFSKELDEKDIYNSNFENIYDEENSLEEMIWNREYPFRNIKKLWPKTYEKYKDYILIAGHTPNINYQEKNILKCANNNKQYKSNIFFSNKGHYINIDCGLALETTDLIQIRLGCLCLDNMKEFYVNKPKSESFIPLFS